MGVRRHTKIIATLGPASSEPATLDALIAAGVDVFRLNFSHGTHDAHASVFRHVRDAAARARRHVAVLQDLSGPKIRTGRLKHGQALTLRPGDELRLFSGDEEGSAGHVCVPYAPLITSARPGDRLLLDDGRIELRVSDGNAHELVTEVVSGGTLGEHKGINAPGVKLPSNAITEKDEADLQFGLDLGVDLVALSFVQTADDVLRAREIARSAGREVPLIAKIERPQAVDNLDAITRVSDGVMVARGDLGLECPLEEVPRVQKLIIRHARTLGRPVIVATQVLESMRTEPRPTRAEVSDAATAVDQGADAIMLAGETAVGAYPVRAVQTLASVICDAETLPAGDMVLPEVELTLSRHGRAMGEAAVTLATTGQAAAIVAVTRQGKTAQLLSALRPRAAIIAVTPSVAVARRLALHWGVTPIVSPLRQVGHLQVPLREIAGIPAGSVVVFVNVSQELSRVDANFVNVQQLGG
ncbi:MAG: pyruvate kinase [Acidobacteria bacterium]|nr:MAG: pyruvate kinase [Acidobacteriota bacterium]